MYEIMKELIGPVPVQFEFIYSILTLVLAFLLISLLFTLFYIPINMVRGK